LEAQCQQDLIGSDQKLPAESTDSADRKQWKTEDNSSSQAVTTFPQAVGDGEKEQFSPSLFLHSTTHQLQKLEKQKGLISFPLFPQDLLRLF
jgi:hypothetical protein